MSAVPAEIDNPGAEQTMDVGSSLSAAREQAGLSIAEVAQHLHLGLNLIQALEGNDPASLPAPTFVRGYLRAYAKLLSLDGNRLVAAFDNHGFDDPKLGSVVGDRHGRVASSRHPMIRWLTLALIAVLIAMMVFWWRAKYGELVLAEPEVQNQVSEQVDTPLAPTELTPRKNAAQPLTSLLANQQRDAVETTAVDAATNEQPSPTATEHVTAETMTIVEDVTSTTEEALDSTAALAEMPTLGADVLLLTGSADSWIEVKDADGEQLMYSLLSSGTSVQLHGKAPFYIFLGNSPAIRLQLNSAPVDQSAFNRRNNTARFLIDDEGIHQP